MFFLGGGFFSAHKMNHEISGCQIDTDSALPKLISSREALMEKSVRTFQSISCKL